MNVASTRKMKSSSTRLDVSDRVGELGTQVEFATSSTRLASNTSREDKNTKIGQYE